MKDAFDRKADSYQAARPNYPNDIVDEMLGGIRNNPPVVADVGAGTGQLTKLLLGKGAIVYAIEPNKDMRRQLEQTLGGNPNLHIVAASAERTMLPDGKADLVTAATAFHWFDTNACKKEFGRILKSGGKVGLVWNRIAEPENLAMMQFDMILRDCSVKEAPGIGRVMNDEFFRGYFGSFKRMERPNDIYLDFNGVLQLVMSMSYAPDKVDLTRMQEVASGKGAPMGEAEGKYFQMYLGIRRWFDDHQKFGAVKVPHNSTLYIGSFEKNIVKNHGR